MLPAVAGLKDVRRLHHDGRSLSVTMRLPFLKFPDFVNTGKDTYTFAIRCITHATRGQILAVDITDYQTKPLEKTSKKEDGQGTKPGEPGQAKQASEAKAAAAAQAAAGQQPAVGTAKK